MSWPFAAVFTLFALGSAAVGLAATSPTSGVSLTLLYPAVSFALVAVAYAGVGAKVLGKRPDGRRSWWAVLLFAPCLLMTRFSFGLYRLFSRQPAVVEVVPGLFLGRRLSAKEAGHLGPVAVLDLAAEFGEVKTLYRGDGYRSLPLLDATAPTAEQLNSAVVWIAEQLARGPVFVHCALGQGRSACVILAYLLQTEKVGDVREGLKLLRRLRPGVGLSIDQDRLLRELACG